MVVTEVRKRKSRSLRPAPAVSTVTLQSILNAPPLINPPSLEFQISERLLTDTRRPLQSQVNKRIFLSAIQRHCQLAFNDLCYYLKQLDVDEHFDMIKMYLSRYSLKIYGLPDCPKEDLYLAVYFFLEEVFGVKCGLELCVRCVDGNDQDFVGVVLSSSPARGNILANVGLLEGTEVTVQSNTDIRWIVEGFCLHRPDL